MTRLLRRRPSPATVLSCLALFVALGGTGYAAATLPRNSVGTLQVRDGSLLARDLKRGEIAGALAASGTTIRGAYFVGSSSATGNQLATGHISFGITLREAPVAHFVEVGAVAPSACPGSAAAPRAARGHLCIYEGRQIQAGGHRIVDPLTGENAGR